MAVSSDGCRLVAAGFAFSAFPLAACPAGHAGDLEAAPWKRIVNTAELPLPGKENGSAFFQPDSGTFAALPKLAEEGNALAAIFLGVFRLFSEKRRKGTSSPGKLSDMSGC